MAVVVYLVFMYLLMNSEMNNCSIIVTTCDKSDWTLQPFAYLFNRYWDQGEKVNIVSESVPPFRLPDNFKVHPIDLDGQKWPIARWSDGLIKYLNSISEQFVIIMLDDYWLTRHVDVHAVYAILEYMSNYRSILRVDLTLDRLYAGGPKYPHDDPDHDHYAHLDFVNRPNTPYQMSLMPGMWNKKLLLDVLQLEWTPWQVELTGTGKVNENGYVVLGTRQWPVRICNALRNGKNEIDTNGILAEDVEVIKKWFKKL